MEANKIGLMSSTAIAPIAWGSNYYVTHQWLPSSIPLTGAAIRALPAGLLLLAVGRKLPQGSWWWRTAIIGTLTVGGFFVLVYVAGSRLPSGVAATLMASSAIVLTGLGRVILGERAPLRTYVGGVVGVAGVALLVGGASGHLDPWGIVASLLAMMSSSLGFILTKKWQPPVPPLTFAAWQLTIGGILLLPVAFVIEGTPPAMSMSTIGAFSYVIVVATALAYVVWFQGLQRLPTGTVGLIGLLNPLAGALLGVIAAHEMVTVPQALGGLAIIGGVSAGIVQRRRPAVSRSSRDREPARALRVRRDQPTPARCRAGMPRHRSLR